MDIRGFPLLALKHIGAMCRESRTAECRAAHKVNKEGRTYRRNPASFDGTLYRIRRRAQHLAVFDDKRGCLPSYTGCAVGARGTH